MCNVVDLRENIVDSVVGLGVNLEFLENPAFVAAMSGIKGLIDEISIEDPNVILIDESDGKLSFSYTASNFDSYKFELSLFDDKTIKCVRTSEPHSYEGEDKSVVRKKNAVEQIARLEDSGEVTIIVNTGMIDNIGCDNHSYNMSNAVERMLYTVDGVMRERENKVYSSRKGIGYFHRVGANEMLLLARQAFIYGPWADVFSKRVLLVRQMLDTARISYEDRDKEHSYFGVVPLNKEKGLRDMFIAEEYNSFPMKDVVIPSITEEEISAIIESESDLKIANGLRGYAYGRTTYHYESAH